MANVEVSMSNCINLHCVLNRGAENGCQLHIIKMITTKKHWGLFVSS